ncbi:hypothetical protein IU459_36915 [Nocardia amamiensis]|uniref:ATP-grasp fold RimK-type domain-containing protein n=1 Tax=Nocardia amamiensis TaxID=404578 RepID=A0ABS0D7E4_9NOCA|nr:hypothetical protein [Nocardia amamiensis]MBF6303043.1 hypothetical protein [Nocardia amamiensis]
MILLLGDKSDPVVGAVASCAGRQGQDYLHLDDRDLVEDLQVDDRLTDNGTDVCWTVRNRTFSSRDICGVLNRLDDLSLGPFTGVDPDDRLYAWQELRAYLLFALNVFPNVINGPRGQEWTTPAPALHHQWAAVRCSRTQLAIPRWSWDSDEDAQPAWVTRRRHRISWSSPWGPASWESPEPARDARVLLHEVPVGYRIELTVVDRRICAWQCRCAIPDRVQIQLTGAIESLPIPASLRAVTITVFYCPHPHLLTYGALQPNLDVAGLTEEQRVRVAQALVAALSRPTGQRSLSARVASRTPRRATTIVPRTARHPVTDPTAVRRIPGTRRIPDSTVNIIASTADPAAAHLYRRARCLGILVAWWPAEELVDLAAPLAELLRHDQPLRGFYFRQPATSDPGLYAAFRAVDALLSDYRGPVVGAGLGYSTNHSKPLHVALLRRLSNHAVRVPDTWVRSSVSGPPYDCGEQVVKALSGSKIQVSTLRELQPDTEFRYSVPLLAQQHITGTNVRVHVVGAESTAVAIDSAALDYRFGNFSVHSSSLRDAVAQWCIRAARAEGLMFAGIDLIEDDDAVWWCLEINPNPGYHVFEKRLPVTDPHRYAVSDSLLACLGAGVCDA